jgi:hypothetical protein
VPISWLYGASAACARSLADAAWPFSALLTAGRIFLHEDLLGPQIREFCVAVVSQEQSPSAVADKHQRIMRNFEIHKSSSLDIRGASFATDKSSRRILSS